MHRSCAYCKRQFVPVNHNQKYCSKSCGNCGRSSDRLSRKDNEDNLIRITGKYATIEGLAEVESGAHDYILNLNRMTKESWMKKWHEMQNLLERLRNNRSKATF